MDFIPLCGDVQQIMTSDTGREFMETGGPGPFKSIRAMREMLGPVVTQMTDDADWKAPPEMTAFLDAGEPPVYVGFGSMDGRSPDALAEIVIGALNRSNQRGVLLIGWGLNLSRRNA